MVVRTNSVHQIILCSQTEKNLQDGETWGRGLEGMDREKKVYMLENKFFHILPLRVGEMF